MPVPYDFALPAASDNPLLEPSPGLMVWTLVVFLITLWILKRYVFGPVAAMVEKRREQIAESIDEAEHSRDEANRLLEDYKVRLAEARREADQLRQQGRKEGERQGHELVDAAQAQRDRVIADADAQIAADVRQAASGLRDDVVVLALMAAEKVTGVSLGDADHRRLIEDAIEGADLEQLGKVEGRG